MNEFPTREQVEQRRQEFQPGTRVELLRMDDVKAPPIGIKGTVMGVDDIGSLLMHWDNGNRLNVLFGVDCVRKIRDEG